MSIEELEAKFEAHDKAEIESRKELTETLTAIRKFLFGNGGVGIDERVRSIEVVVEEWAKLKRWLMAVVGGIGVKIAFDIFTWYQESKS